jgi:hypothetical protein
MFGKLRILFNLPTQHKGQRPTTLPLDIEVKGIKETIMLAISDYPAVPIVFPIFRYPPGILTGSSPNAVYWNAGSVPVMAPPADNEERLTRFSPA